MKKASTHVPTGAGLDHRAVKLILYLFRRACGQMLVSMMGAFFVQIISWSGVLFELWESRCTCFHEVDLTRDGGQQGSGVHEFRQLVDKRLSQQSKHEISLTSFSEIVQNAAVDVPHTSMSTLSKVTRCPDELKGAERKRAAATSQQEKKMGRAEAQRQRRRWKA